MLLGFVYITTTNLPNNFYCVSAYYQIVNFLNTKNNVVMLLMLYVIVNFNNTKNALHLGGFGVMIVWLCYLNIIIEVNTVPFSFLGNLTALNTNLLNGIMLIHPMLLYTFYSVYILGYKVNLQKKIVSTKKNSKHNDLKFQYLNLVIIFYAIVLGGWWAEQELSWGGWWSWDFVELLSINYLLYQLSAVHMGSDNFFVSSSAKLRLCILVVAVLSVRYNVINSIHNFISLESQNQYMYYTTTLLFVLVLLCLSKIKNKNVLFLKFSIKNIFFIFLFLFFLCLLLTLNTLSVFYALNINPLTNIKGIYMWTILLLIVLWCSLKKLDTGSVLVIVLLLVCIGGMLLVDTIFVVAILFTLKKSKVVFKKKNLNLLHSMFFFLVLLTVHQIYNFVQLNTHTNITTILPCSLSNINISLITTTLVSCDKINNFDLVAGLWKTIFEKFISYGQYTGVLKEIYSYNNQTLLQLYGVCIFFVLLCIHILSVRVYLLAAKSSNLYSI